ncbi:MAG: hypothetical protein JO202_08235 [Ktedonobacteraceae bacterium]|nr:hypothetical protein [Ktedonobacteraceae bacterium]
MTIRVMDGSESTTLLGLDFDQMVMRVVRFGRVVTHGWSSFHRVPLPGARGPCNNPRASNDGLFVVGCYQVVIGPLGSAVLRVFALQAYFRM